MREFNLEDVFMASRIFKKIGIKDAGINFEGSQEEAGGRLFLFLIENIDQAREEICEFLAQILEIDNPEKLPTMSIKELMSKFNKIEGMRNFLELLRQSMKLKLANLYSEDTEKVD